MEDDHNSKVPDAFSKCPLHEFLPDTSSFAVPGLCLRGWVKSVPGSKMSEPNAGWCKCLCVTCRDYPGGVTRQCVQALQVKQKAAPWLQVVTTKAMSLLERVKTGIPPQNPWVHWQPIFKLLCSCSGCDILHIPYFQLPGVFLWEHAICSGAPQQEQHMSSSIVELFSNRLQVRRVLRRMCSSLWSWLAMNIHLPLRKYVLALQQSQGLSVQACAFAPVQCTQCLCTSAGFSLWAVTGRGGERRGEQQPLIKTQPPWP